MHLRPALLLAAIILNAVAVPSSSNVGTNTLTKREPKSFGGWKIISPETAAAKIKRGATHFDYTTKQSLAKRETYQADLEYLAALQNSTNEEFLTRLDAAGGTCNSTSIARRQEYGSLTAAQQIAYTDAVLCLQNKTANTPSSLVPGAKTRFDDFVAALKFFSMAVIDYY